MTSQLYKVSVRQTLAMTDVIEIADGVAAATPLEAEIRGVELQRIDTSPSATVVFVTGSDASVQCFAEGLMRSAKGPGAEVAEIEAAALGSTEVLTE